MTSEEAEALLVAGMPTLVELVKTLSDKGTPDRAIIPVIADSTRAKLEAETDWDAAMRKKFGG